MRISYSQYKLFMFCPLAWYERYVRNIVKPPGEARIFGSRFDQILEEHYRTMAGWNGIVYEPSDNPDIEAEAQAMYGAYMAHYPVEPFEVVAAQPKIVLPIPGSEHELVVIPDNIVSDLDTGKLEVLETKTEKRNGVHNLPKSWNARMQVTLYKWAVEQAYQEPVKDIIINICTRGSPGGKEGPSFRRDYIDRTPEQISQALRDIADAADDMMRMQNRGWFRRNTEACMDGRYECEYYTIHNVADSEELRNQLYVPYHQQVTGT